MLRGGNLGREGGIDKWEGLGSCDLEYEEVLVERGVCGWKRIFVKRESVGC